MDPSSMLLLRPEHNYINYKDSLALSGCTHAAHCCIYSYNPRLVIHERYPTKAAILMQMRFDGHLGFPGGIVDEGKDTVCGLNRELKEEINLDSKFFVTDENYLFTYRNEEENMCLHFYSKEVSLEEFKSIERNTFDAVHYGDETFGLLRVPLYTMDDGFRGFPAFLTNAFAGNAKDQLLNFLVHSKLMSIEEITEALGKAKIY